MKPRQVIEQTVAGLSDTTLAKWACWGPRGCQHDRKEHEPAIVEMLYAGFMVGAPSTSPSEEDR